MAEDAEQAMGVAASGDVQFAQYSSNIICFDEDLDRLHENTRLVMKTIQNLGFACRLETINAVEAWRGSLARRRIPQCAAGPPAYAQSGGLLPITSVWAGLRENPSRLMPKQSPPLLFAATTGATPFRVNLHVSDLGHTLMCGPSGAGKSTALGLIAAQWFRYPRAQVFAFDKGYSLFVLTKAAGGEFYDLAGEKTELAFCPLREIDSDADLTWAVTWLEDLCSLNGLAVTAEASERAHSGAASTPPVAVANTHGAERERAGPGDPGGAPVLHSVRSARATSRCRRRRAQFRPLPDL